MPKPFIATARETLAHLKIETQEDAARVQARTIQALQAARQDVAVHRDDTPSLARVDFGRWIIDCACGSGVAVHPDWTAAYCLGCGAVLSTIIWPENRVAIEAVLGARVQPRQQFFNPAKGETVASLEAENLARDVAPIGKGSR